MDLQYSGKFVVTANNFRYSPFPQRSSNSSAVSQEPTPLSAYYYRYQGNVYMFGGFTDAFSPSNEIWMYNSIGQVWTLLTTSGITPTEIYDHTCVLINSTLLVSNPYQLHLQGRFSVDKMLSRICSPLCTVSTSLLQYGVLSLLPVQHHLLRDMITLLWQLVESCG